MENVSRVSRRFFFSLSLKIQIEIPFINFRAFAVDNHINVCKSSYRGRPVTSVNVQDYISNIVSKYLPVGLPPWQICVIPVIGPTSTTSSTRPEDIASVASTSASGNDTEEEQPSSSDLGAVRRYLYHGDTSFIRLKCYRQTEGHVSFDTSTSASMQCRLSQMSQIIQFSITLNQTFVLFAFTQFHTPSKSTALFSFCYVFFPYFLFFLSLSFVLPRIACYSLRFIMKQAINADWPLLRSGANASSADIRGAKSTLVWPTCDWYSVGEYFRFECTRWTWNRCANTQFTAVGHHAVSRLHSTTVHAPTNRSDECLQWIQEQVRSLCWKTVQCTSDNNTAIRILAISRTERSKIGPCWNVADRNAATVVCIVVHFVCDHCQWLLQGILCDETSSDD